MFFANRRTRKIFPLFMAGLSFLQLPVASAGTLTVQVKDANGAAVSGASVYAVAFGARGPSTDSLVGTTDGSGNAVLSLDNTKEYDVIADKTDLGPTARTQFFSQSKPHVLGSATQSKTITLSQDLSGRGIIRANVSNATANKFVVGNVRKKSTNADVGFGGCVADGSGNCSIFFNNVPVAAANTYEVGVFDPAGLSGEGVGFGAQINGAITAGGTTVVAIDLSQGRRPDLSAEAGQGGPLEGCLVRGMVRDSIDASKVVPNTFIELQHKVNGKLELAMGVPVSKDGHFEVRNIAADKYWIRTPGGCNPDNNLCYQGKEPNGANPEDFEVFAAEVSNKSTKNIDIPLAQTPVGTGQLKVIVKNDAGVIIPNSWVNVNGDWSMWQEDGSALTCDGSDTVVQRSAFYQQNVQATSGKALFQKIPDGNKNLVVQVWTPFSRQATMFNGGADKEFNWGGGVRGCNADIPASSDDRRININNGTVTVYDPQGASVAGAVTSDGGVPAITVVVPTSNGGDGTVNVTATFTDVADLRTDPITFTLQHCDGQGCSGNFGVIGGAGSTPSNTYTTSVTVPSVDGNGDPISYRVEVQSNYWGVVRNGGGDLNVSFKGTKTVPLAMKLAPAGQIKGFVYLPDGSVAAPKSSGNQWINYGVNAQGDNNWGYAQVQKDGSFTIGGLIPGNYRLVANQYGGNSTLAPDPKTPAIIVSANKDTDANVKFVNGVVVSPDYDASKLPSLTRIIDTNGGGNNYRGETWQVLRVKAGAQLDANTLLRLLVHEDEKDTFRETPAYSGSGNCGNNWPGGICPDNMAVGDAYDFYMTRNGSVGDGDSHQYMTFTSALKNVPVDAAKATAPQVSFHGQLTNAVHLPFDVTAVSAGTNIGGTVAGTNILRRADFEAMGGSFEKFIALLPRVTALDAETKEIIGIGLVTPPPAALRGDVTKQIDQAIATNDYDRFLHLAGTLTWEYELRGIPPHRPVALTLKTQNYPDLFKKVRTGEVGTKITWNVDLDKDAGTGGVVAGTVTSAAGGAAVDGARVEIRAPGMEDRRLTTDAQGKFTSPGLPHAPYTITVFAGGFAPRAKRTVISANETDTIDFSLVAGPGSISGKVTKVAATSEGVVTTPVASQMVIAFDDTENAASPSEPLALIHAMTSETGAYKLEGMIPTHTYKVTVKAAGYYPKSLDVVATNSEVSGTDFKLDPKPLSVDVIVDFDVVKNQFIFKILNPHNFDSGKVWVYNAGTTFNAGSDREISTSFANMPDGSLIARDNVSHYAADTNYRLHILATPADGGQDVVTELDFSLKKNHNANIEISEALTGDSTPDDKGQPENRILGPDGSYLDVEAGAMLNGATGDKLPTATVTSEDSSKLGDDATRIVGDAVTVTLNDVQFTDRQVPFSIPFDPNTVEDQNELKDMALFALINGKWVKITSDVSIDPLNGTASGFIDLNNQVASQTTLASAGGAKLASAVGTTTAPKAMGLMKAIKTQNGYSKNPRAMAAGAVTFAVGLVPSTTTATALGYHQYNFPNPFNLKDKTVAPRAGTTGVPTSIRGTYIVVAPTGTGTVGVTIRIYNVAGDMVRELKGDCDAGRYNYFHWDGRNTAGDDVASGVYFARVDAPGAPKREPIKMVLVK